MGCGCKKKGNTKPTNTNNSNKTGGSSSTTPKK